MFDLRPGRQQHTHDTHQAHHPRAQARNRHRHPTHTIDGIDAVGVDRGAKWQLARCSINIAGLLHHTGRRSIRARPSDAMLARCRGPAWLPPVGRVADGCTALLVFVVQITTIAAYGSRMEHLTNWAWVLGGLFAGIRFIGPVRLRPPVTLAATGTSAFIAGGMLALQLQDNYFVNEAEGRYGVGLVNAGNVLLHYTLPVYFVIMAWVDRTQLTAWCSTADVWFVEAVCMLPAVQLGVCYAIQFSLAKSYPGNMDFSLITTVGLLSEQVCIHAVLPRSPIQ